MTAAVGGSAPAGRVGALERALLALLDADAHATTARTRRAIELLRAEIQAVRHPGRQRPPGAAQVRILAQLVDDGPSTEAELRPTGDRPSHVTSSLLGLHSRGLVEAERRPGQPELWRLTDQGLEWYLAHEAGRDAATAGGDQ